MVRNLEVIKLQEKAEEDRKQSEKAKEKKQKIRAEHNAKKRKAAQPQEEMRATIDEIINKVYEKCSVIQNRQSSASTLFDPSKYFII